MPPFINHNAKWGVPNTKYNPMECFGENVAYFPQRNYTITGVTKGSDGTALGSCIVKLFDSATNICVQQVTSDASGNYSFVVPSYGYAFYVTAYKAGAPDVAGTSSNTLVGV